MENKTHGDHKSMYTWHRNLLVAAAVLTTLLIAMGGVLCVTASIRNCPDWPGCFGRIIPPAESGPILEYIHRVLAGLSSLLIVSTAVVGMARVPRLRWVSIPPLVALALLLEVSFFGAQVVLHGLAPGWAAVDVGSALLVVALMVTAAMKASIRISNPALADPPGFKTPYAKLTLATVSMVYVVMLSGVLVAGKGSITGCLGWPLYSLKQFQLDGHMPGNAIRLGLSIIAIGMLVAVLFMSWQRRHKRRGSYFIARWVGLAFILEAFVQILLQLIGLTTPLLVVYTVIAALFWALLVALGVRASLRVA